MKPIHWSLILAAALAACGRQEPPKPASPPEKLGPRLSPEDQVRHQKLKAEFDAEMAKIPAARRAKEAAFEAAVKAGDEAELVRPAPPGFKPEPVRRKVKLTLIPKKTVLKPGERLWYRLEMQNLGKETISFNSNRSFWKEGNAEFSDWKFYVTPPGGKEEHTFIRYYDYSVMGHGARGGMNAAQRKEHAFRIMRRSALDVDVKPGQTLVTKAWRLLSYGELDDRYYKDIEPAPVVGEFRELALEEFRFDARGVPGQGGVSKSSAVHRARFSRNRQIWLGTRRVYSEIQEIEQRTPRPCSFQHGPNRD